MSLARHPCVSRREPAGHRHEGLEAAGGGDERGGLTGVSATISAGVSTRPSIVPNAQPASEAITTPAATSWVASPRKVQAWSRSQAMNVISQQALPRSRSRPGRRPGVERPQGVGADADVVLVVERVGVVDGEAFAVAPGASADDGPEQFAQRRDGDHPEGGRAGVDQADADGPERAGRGPGCRCRRSGRSTTASARSRPTRRIPRRSDGRRGTARPRRSRIRRSRSWSRSVTKLWLAFSWGVTPLALAKAMAAASRARALTNSSSASYAPVGVCIRVGPFRLSNSSHAAHSA